MGVGLVGAFAASVHGNGCMVATDAAGHIVQNTCPRPGPMWLQVLTNVVLSLVPFVLPLVTAGYLALRLRWGRRAQVFVG